MEHQAFVRRVLEHLPARPSTYQTASWSWQGRPTKEGVGVMPIAGVDPDRVIEAVFDLDHYVGNVDHVAACRTIADPRFTPPASVRFYQRVDIPMLGSVQHELVLHDLDEIDGWHVAAWDILGPETDALDPKVGFRSDYNHGAWLAKPGLLAYALGSAPRKGDVGRLKFAALTKGSDAAASRVLKNNLECMARWAARR